MKNNQYIPKKTDIIIRIERIICDAANITLENMLSQNRSKELVEARIALWFIIHDYLGYSYPTIGRIYKRDHTTVMSGVRKMRKSGYGNKIVDGLNKSNPDLNLRKTPHGSKPYTMENWRFERISTK